MIEQVRSKIKDLSGELRLKRIDGGLQRKYIEMQIEDTQSPYMVNLNANDKGALVKRYGHELLHTFLEGPVYNAIEYDSKQVVSHGTKLSTYIELTDTEAEIDTVADAKGTFFKFIDYLYYINGTDYVSYNGTTCAAPTPYIPTLTLGRDPSGGGTANENWNLYGSGFKDSFTSDGVDTTYYLSLTGLNATAVTLTIDGVAKTEDTHFSVNRTNGTVDFTGGSSPHGAPLAGTNNVVITAYKTFSGYADRIKNCTTAIVYGGANDTRVFLTGNLDYPNRIYYSGLNDASYFPENDYNDIGSDNEGAVKQFAIHRNDLIVFKEKAVYLATYSLDDSGNVSFPTYQLNSGIGCDIPNSVQVVQDTIVFSNSYLGIHLLVSTELRNERNLVPISGNINGAEYRTGLLNEENVTNAVSYDFNGKYHLCVNDKVWLWDYSLSPYYDGKPEDTYVWFYYESINANCVLTNSSTYYYGDRNTGKYYKLWENYNDDGTAINSVWKSKLFHFGYPEWYKTVWELWYTTRALAGSTVSLTYYNENGDEVETDIIPASDTTSFSWSTFSWSNFTWAVYRYARTIYKKVKQKNIVFWQVELSNNELNENLSILELVVKYILSKRVK